MTPNSRPPYIRISSSDPGERGRQLGEEAGERVKRSIANYRETFAHYTGLDWPEVCERASAFLPEIRAYDPDIAQEMTGIAEGAGVALEDIVAVNARTEVMYGLSADMKPECTAFSSRGSAIHARPMLLGQNWDWRPVTLEACILLEVQQGPKPSFITFLEAGLVGKMGFNSAGIGMVTNLLVSDLDRGTPAVPFHVILRGILNASTLAAAVHAITSHERAASANYLVASEDGTALNIEAGPGGIDTVGLSVSDDGLLAHANTFQSPPDHVADLGRSLLPDSPARADRMMARLRAVRSGDSLGEEQIREILADHQGYPASICRHLNLDEHPIERISTNASIILNLTERTLDLAVGPPCEGEYERIQPSFSTREPALQVSA